MSDADGRMTAREARKLVAWSSVAIVVFSVGQRDDVVALVSDAEQRDRRLLVNATIQWSYETLVVWMGGAVGTPIRSLEIRHLYDDEEVKATVRAIYVAVNGGDYVGAQMLAERIEPAVAVETFVVIGYGLVEAMRRNR